MWFCCSTQWPKWLEETRYSSFCVCFFIILVNYIAKTEKRESMYPSWDFLFPALFLMIDFSQLSASSFKRNQSFVPPEIDRVKQIHKHKHGARCDAFRVVISSVQSWLHHYPGSSLFNSIRSQTLNSINDNRTDIFTIYSSLYAGLYALTRISDCNIWCT